MKKIITAFAILFAVSSNFSFAHSGRTDANGCHHDRKSGTYHCH
nr:YHYH domain-containing protein [uncultured Methylotenera sp.]